MKRVSPPPTSRRMAEMYATHSPAVIRCGWGQERNRNGGDSSLAILALQAVAGKFGVRGGGYSMSNTAAWGIERTWIGAQEPPTRSINMNQLGRALTELDAPPVNVLFVYNSNAAVTSPNQRRILQGLERDDLFTVVFEQVMTDTARYADVGASGDDVPRGVRHRARLRTNGSAAREAGDRSRRGIAVNAEVFGELMSAARSGRACGSGGRAGRDARCICQDARARSVTSCASRATPPRWPVAGRFNSST